MPTTLDYKGTPALQDTAGLKWYQGLDRYCWIVLAIAALGWLFDTMDQNLMNLVRAPSLKEILHPHPNRPALTVEEKIDLDKRVKDYGGKLTSIFLLGWAAGGFIFGILGDRLGRTRTMILTILVYAIFTGGSGLVHSFGWYAFMRFMTALGVGGEWAAGAALVAEVFPSRARPMALGLLQALSAVGNMLAAVIYLVISQMISEANQASSWRWAYFVGAAPALLVIWIQSSVREPPQWQEAKRQASLGKELGNITDLFTHPILRRNTIAAALMATAGVCAVWGVAFFSTDFVREELTRGGLGEKAIATRTSIMFFAQQVGAFFGIYLFAVFSVRFSRKEAFFFWFGLAWASVMLFFWAIVGSGSGAFVRAVILAPVLGFGTLGPFSGYTVYFPELFPTRLRSTGCGFCYNAARILAAGGPFALGSLSAHFSAAGGFAAAASAVSCIYFLGIIGTLIAPETKGKPLPEDKDFEEVLARPVVATAEPE
jgi:MFS family permease